MPSFKKIRERAAKRKGGEAALNKLLGAKPDNAKLKKVPDDRILSTMADRIFSAGFVWSVIEAKWPGFEEAFLGFEPKVLLFQPEDFWHDLTSDKRIVRTGSPIELQRHPNHPWIEEYFCGERARAAQSGEQPRRLVV